MTSCHADTDTVLVQLHRRDDWGRWTPDVGSMEEPLFGNSASSYHPRKHKVVFLLICVDAQSDCWSSVKANVMVMDICKCDYIFVMASLQNVTELML